MCSFKTKKQRNFEFCIVMASFRVRPYSIMHMKCNSSHADNKYVHYTAET
jgi:hypothetical protein